MRYLLGFFWGIVLLASFAGWGNAVRGILRNRVEDEKEDWGQEIVLGMSWIIAMGGFLNLASAMTRGTVLTLAAIGLSLFAMAVWRFRTRHGWRGMFDWPRSGLEIFTLLACLVNYSGYVCLSFSPYGDPDLRQRFSLNAWDDLKGGYVTLPMRLLTEGNLGDDSFNTNRSLALGGLSLLQAFPLSVLPVTYVHVLDPGLAILTLPLVLHGLGKRRDWPVWLAPLLTLFCLVLRSPRVSSSAALLPSVFFLALYGMLAELAERQRARTAGLLKLALVVAAVMTLKNTLVPGTAFILGIFLGTDWIVRRDLRRSVVAGVTTGLAILLSLAPWFVSSYRAAGTPLYPLLGVGYRAASLVEMPRPAPLRDLATELRAYSAFARDPRLLLFNLLCVMGLVVSFRRGLWSGREMAYVAVVLGTIPVILVYVRTFPVDWLRYSYNYLTLALLTSFSVLLGEPQGRDWLDRTLPAGTRWMGGLLVLLTVAGGIYHCRYVQHTAKMISNEVTGRGWNPNLEAEEYRRMQSSIPAGHTFLAFLPMAHLLDFGRNPIQVVDGMCGISPPPGIPLKGDPEDVAQYLRQHGITRIATRLTTWYPGGETRDPEDLRRWSEDCEDKWMRSLVYANYLMTDRLGSLTGIYKAARFENDLVVINLEP